MILDKNVVLRTFVLLLLSEQYLELDGNSFSIYVILFANLILPSDLCPCVHCISGENDLLCICIFNARMIVDIASTRS